MRCWRLPGRYIHEITQVFRYCQQGNADSLLDGTLALLKDPRTPLAAKLVAGVVVAYALSPIDLIPDFIPVLGLLDDVILVPLGVALAVKLVPTPLWAEMRQQAESFQGRLPKMMWGLLIVAAIWLVLLAAFIYWLVHSVLNA